jgi:4,5-dihydroxyphthalate decarboxylase
MARLPLTVAVSVYDRTYPLMTGAVRPEGIDLNVIPLQVEEIFWRQNRHEEFDASELSGTVYHVERSRPNPRFIAVPVYLSRTFRHNAIYVHVGSGIERPQDLAGRKVGIPEYSVTAATWMRAFLQHDYGVHPSQIRWMTGGEERPGREERIRNLPVPADVSIEPIPPDQTLNAMIVSGGIDALICPRLPRPMAEGNPNVRRLIQDFPKVEEEYYRRTGIFPIMHFLAIRTEVYERNPWVAENLYKAFCQAKDFAVRELFEPNALVVSLPWLVPEVERERTIFGPDLWSYGVEANRPTLDAMMAYHVEQGLIPKAIPIEEMFAPSTLAEFKI